ncbi:MAG: hypothetical protein QNK37_24490 [Acidobacteriota bacterium]|nr:hypothetical protein [Acidobacteriota bacterium]
MTEVTGYVAGRLVEDLSFRPLEPREYRVRLEGHRGEGIRKEGGFFCFPKVPPGTYVFHAEGRGFRAYRQEVKVTDAPLVLRPPGENELWVTVTASRDTPDFREVQFKAVNLTRVIRAGAAVLGKGLETRLLHAIGPGEEAAARLEPGDPIATGSILRLVREHSCRMRFSPFHLFNTGMLSLVGRITRGVTPDPGASARITHIDDRPLKARLVNGARLLVVGGRSPVIMGSENDLVCPVDGDGNFHLYLPAALVNVNVTIAIESAGIRHTYTEPGGGGRRFRKIDLLETSRETEALKS